MDQKDVTAEAPTGDPQSCPYRGGVRQDSAGKEVASCGLAGAVIGVTDPEILAVSRGACELCVARRPSPDQDNPNPIAASLVYVAGERIVERGGVPGCDLSRAREIMGWAAQHLDVVGGRADVRVRAHGRRDPCLFLGRQTGWKPCTSCAGSTRQKVFACNHQAHTETTILDCGSCPDHDRRLEAGGALAWVAGVTTAPRPRPTLERSLLSLASAGWPDANVFAEPGSELPAWLPPHRLVQRASTLGAWPNWFLALSELVARHPWADAYLICQDDVLYARDLRAYLERTLWPSDRVGVVSLHTALHQEAPADTRGYFELGSNHVMAWGAQAYAIPNASARAILRSSIAVNHRHRGARHGLCNVDTIVGQCCEEVGLPYLLHSPSPTQHIGEASAIWGNIGTVGRRHAGTFPEGERGMCEIMGLESPPERKFPAPASPGEPWEGALVICSPLIGRRAPFDRWKHWLLEAELPPHTTLCLLDNSGDRAFAALCQDAAGEFADSGRFAEVNLHVRRKPPAVPPRNTPARHWCVADAYNAGLAAASGDELFVFLLDDDTIPPTDCLPKLYGGLAEIAARGGRPGAISGCYESAGNPGHLVASESKLDWSRPVAIGTSPVGDLAEVGLVGSGCLLLDGRWFWDSSPVRGESMAGVLGPDAYLSHEAARKGYSVWLHAGVVCDHLFADPPKSSPDPPEDTA